MKSNWMKKIYNYPLLCILGLLYLSLTGCGTDVADDSLLTSKYTEKAYVVLNNNQPEFTEVEKQSVEAVERYSELDSLGRCGAAYANLCPELKPTEERGAIGQIKPSGWHTVKYSDIIEDNYLYNRCHLIGYQLAGENANEKNLITGTRYLNVTGMLPFENEVSEYVDSTGNHVLYRVTPVFEGDNVLASGVQMEAWSVEDEGKGICFNVYCYNVQPGIVIDYATGDSSEDVESKKNIKKETDTAENCNFVLNTNTMKIHLPNCSSVKRMSENNKRSYTGTIEDLINQGYSPCKNCLGAYSKESK